MIIVKHLYFIFFVFSYIYFIHDPAHLIKTARNNLLSGKKHLWNNGDLTWKPIKKMIEEDISRGDLRFFPKLTSKHCYPSAYDKMKVNIAAQICPFLTKRSNPQISKKGFLIAIGL